MPAKIKYVTETPDSRTEATPEPMIKTSGMAAYDKVTDYDANFISKLCGGVGTTVMHVDVFNPETQEKIFDFDMRVLSIKEEEEVAIQALEEFNKLPEHCRNTHLLALKEAFLRVRKSLIVDHLAKTPQCGEETLKRMTQNQILALHTQYNRLSNMISPCLDLLSQAELSELVEAVKKNSAVATTLPQPQAGEVILAFWDLLKELQMVSSSTT